MDDSDVEPSATKWWPVASLLFVAGAVCYAWLFGLTALPPIIALLLLAASSNVLYGLLTWVLPSHNMLAGALKGVAFMLSLVCGVVASVWVVWLIFSAEVNPIERLLVDENALALFSLVACLLLVTLAFTTAVLIWLTVRHDALGKQQRPKSL